VSTVISTRRAASHQICAIYGQKVGGGGLKEHIIYQKQTQMMPRSLAREIILAIAHPIVKLSRPLSNSVRIMLGY